MMKIHFALRLSVAALTALGTANAAPITIDFTTNSVNTVATSSGSGFGNIRTFANGGVTATATAWGVTGAGSTLLAGESGRYSLGLGVCNAIEGTNRGSPNHQVDNSSQLDFLLFTFSAAINSVSITITPAGNYDTDATYYTRSLGASFNLSGSTLAGLGGLGFGGGINSDTSTSGVARTINIGGSGITSILFGARVNNADCFADYFKITALDASSSVPEPATFGLLGAALLGIGVVVRRFKRSGKA